MEFFLARAKNDGIYIFQNEFYNGSISFKLYDFFIRDWALVLLNIVLFFFLTINTFLNHRATNVFMQWFVTINVLNLIFRFVERIIEYTEAITNNSIRNFSFSHLFYLGSYYLLITILTAVTDAQSVKEFSKNSHHYVEFQNGKIFKPDSSNFLIGKTNDFIFLYHKKERRSEVIKIVDVRTINYISASLRGSRNVR